MQIKGIIHPKLKSHPLSSHLGFNGGCAVAVETGGDKQDPVASKLTCHSRENVDAGYEATVGIFG